MSYHTEFPDFDDEITLPDGWEDVSWHNDSCPSFFNKEKLVVLYIDYKDPLLREHMEIPRYGAYSTDADGARINGIEVEGDDLEDVLSRIDAAKKAVDTIF